MKFLFIIFLLFCLRVSSQTQKIKVRKEVLKINTEKVTQANICTHALLCGKYYGEITLAEVFLSNKIKVGNNDLDWKILSFQITFKARTKLIQYETTGDSITENIKKDFIMCQNKSMFFIEKIKAVSKNNDTVYLNPISLKIVE